jgi:putative phosphonate metabolism protein
MMVQFPEPLAGPVESGARYAIYFAPAPETALHVLGSQWLGRDSVSGEYFDQPSIADMPASRLKELTSEPRRYGFHATLKPPFHLKPGMTIDGLLDATRAFAQTQQPYAVNMVLRQFSDFFALMQGQSKAETRALAAAAVSELDPFRALPSERDLERRRKPGLSGAQETLLQRWGYPYVMNEFRFHMTLTKRVTAEGEAAIMRPALHDHFAAIFEALQTIDAIAVFREAAPGEPFIQIERFRLGNGV